MSIHRTSPPDGARQVPCPTCGQPSRFAPENPWRPFCSERCRSVDFGAWASERYRVAAPPGPDDAPDGSAH
ncbi:DNA gyrase inhibitor YacG [Aquabacterium sp.]|uniref:DNA gyrase inhibitor YacG n=1 Tax=Aquabacterium sp. TaxID=1872578 RepID=UPI003783497C